MKMIEMYKRKESTKKLLSIGRINHLRIDENKQRILLSYLFSEEEDFLEYEIKNLTASKTDLIKIKSLRILAKKYGYQTPSEIISHLDKSKKRSRSKIFKGEIQVIENRKMIKLAGGRKIRLSKTN